jgi:hypothetical protein
VRSIIKNILNEEVENLQNIQKGIDLTIKFLSKKFPFIVGWKFADPIDKYEHSIYINLKVDLEKVKEYYGLDLDDIYEKYPDFIYDEESTKAYPFSALKYDGVIEDAYLESKDIWIMLDSIYGDMPDKLKSYGDVGSKQLSIDGYIYVK